MTTNSVYVHIWVIALAFFIGMGFDAFLGRVVSFIKFLRQ